MNNKIEHRKVFSLLSSPSCKFFGEVKVLKVKVI